MERAHIFRFLRYAVTALSLTACALLVGLWVRSYYVPYKLIRVNKSQTVAIGILSDRRGLVFGRFDLAADPRLMLLKQQLMQQLQFALSDSSRRGWSQRSEIQVTIESVQLKIARDQVQMVTKTMSQRRPVPYWLLLLVAATIMATPWINWRFSLRTLLIATTLVALGLAVIVGAAR